MKLKPSINLSLIVLVFFNVFAVEAQNRAGALPRLDPDKKALEYFNLGKKAGGYSWQELAEISLWASGDTSASNLEKIRAAADTLKKAEGLPSDDKEKAEFILGFLHKNYLKTYSLTQTRVDTIFSGGRFNCVSSAVLYIILCESVGIETSGVVTKDHALVTVHIGINNIDVETTNPYGFDPGNRKEFHDNFGKLTGFSYVPARNYRDRQTISPIELISLIMNNRISELESKNNFVDAVPISIDRAALLEGPALAVNEDAAVPQQLFEDPRRSMMDRIFNYGASLLKAGKEEEGLRWAAAASKLYPSPKRWSEFVLASANNNVMKLAKAGKTAEAKKFLDAQKNVLSQVEFKQLEEVIIDTELLNSANKIRTAAEGDAVVAAVEQARANGKSSEQRAVELRTYAIQKTAAALCAAPARNWRAAVDYIQSALSRFGANRELEQALKTYRSNLAADYHNRFAAAFNKRNFEEADRILNEGLAEIPDDRQLLSDRAAVDKARN